MIGPDSVPLTGDGKSQAGLRWRPVMCRHHFIPSYLPCLAFLLEFKLLGMFGCF